MRCLVTESLAVFLDTTTAYPLTSLGRIAIKFADETRLPIARAVEKSSLFNRFRRGNTAVLRSKALATDSAPFLHNLAAGARFGPYAESVSFRSLPLFGLVCSFRHDKYKIKLYT